MHPISAVSDARAKSGLLEFQQLGCLALPWVTHNSFVSFSAGLDSRQAQVIVLSSGTKCINGEYINDQGLVVNDCHAEIVARRAFVHFLYSQLELHLR